MKKLLFKTRRCAGALVGDKPVWQGAPCSNGWASPEEVAALVAGETRQSASDVMYTHVKTGEAVHRLLREGCNVSLDWVTFMITITGSFQRIDDGFDKSRNSLLVRAHARPFLRDCLSGITPRNVTNGLTASIQSVIDTAAQAEGVITTTTVYIAGKNLLVGDSPDEGVALMAKDGTVAAVPTITANTNSTMDLAFDELPPDGEYVLVVKARTGASTDFAPAVAKRNVTVSSAS